LGAINIYYHNIESKSKTVPPTYISELESDLDLMDKENISVRAGLSVFQSNVIFADTTKGSLIPGFDFIL